ncbi:MAG: class I SAM-dependent methyltransferase [Gammaproteobacteria bacterium]|nr:class I SAM-dependent methyltransferase [Gammaproteobacteria bacterium]
MIEERRRDAGLRGSATAFPGAEPQRRLAGWFSTPSGARLLAAERAPLAKAVRLFHGDAMLWLGAPPGLIEVTSRCMVRLTVHNLPVGDAAGAGTASRIVADPMDLPLAAGSLDGVVLHHVLEAAPDPRAVLREVTRALRPGGRLLVAGFNPLSLWSLARLRPALRGLRPVGTLRLSDWLAVLGFERSARTIHLHYRGALPFALAHDHWRRASALLGKLQLPFGGVYLLAATKVGHGYIIERAERRRAQRALAGPLPSPARRLACLNRLRAADPTASLSQRIPDVDGLPIRAADG